MEWLGRPFEKHLEMGPVLIAAVKDVVVTLVPLLSGLLMGRVCFFLHCANATVPDSA